MAIKKLKENYNTLRKKYSLPKFEELNNNFEIEKTNTESEILLKEIRKTMFEKVVSYLKMAETILNPSQASPIFMILTKEIFPEDRKVIDKILKEFVVLEINSLRLDVESSEKKEAEEIKNIYDKWNSSKEDLNKIINLMERNLRNSGTKKQRDYFG